jgi:hypothetical protein
MEAALSATAAVSAGLQTSILLAGAMSAPATVSAGITTGIWFVAPLSATASVSAALDTAPGSLVGAVDVLATVAAVLDTRIDLGAQASAIATAWASTLSTGGIGALEGYRLTVADLTPRRGAVRVNVRH